MPNGLLSSVGARGFEPPTFCSQSRRATRLRHAPYVSGSLPTGGRGSLHDGARRCLSACRCRRAAGPGTPVPPRSSVGASMRSAARSVGRQKLRGRDRLRASAAARRPIHRRRRSARRRTRSSGARGSTCTSGILSRPIGIAAEARRLVDRVGEAAQPIDQADRLRQRAGPDLPAPELVDARDGQPARLARPPPPSR